MRPGQARPGQARPGQAAQCSARQRSTHRSAAEGLGSVRSSACSRGAACAMACTQALCCSGTSSVRRVSCASGARKAAQAPGARPGCTAALSSRSVVSCATAWSVSWSSPRAAWGSSSREVRPERQARLRETKAQRRACQAVPGAPAWRELSASEVALGKARARSSVPSTSPLSSSSVITSVLVWAPSRARHAEEARRRRCLSRRFRWQPSTRPSLSRSQPGPPGRTVSFSIAALLRASGKGAIELRASAGSRS
jgi:hypothetical protein